MDIIEKINKLKKERNAVILAHNYQLGEIQDIADYTGDSLGLSIEASKVEADVIVFCGVHFMAETAKIISPGKKVIIPVKSAGCPMANMVTVDKLKEMKEKLGNPAVACYINSSAEVKAETDLACTSSNAVDIIKKLYPNKERILFVPDKNLGEYVSDQVDNEIVLWPGYCPTHMKILPEDIFRLKEENPEALVLVHPECAKPTREAADKLFSTGQMLKFVKESDVKTFIIGTEVGIIHALEKENPGKKFIPVTDRAVCPNMKKTKIEDVLWALEEMKTEIILDEDIMNRARVSIERMLQLSN